MEEGMACGGLHFLSTGCSYQLLVIFTKYEMFNIWNAVPAFAPPP